MASIEQLIARLARGKPVPAIVLEGMDSYLRALCRKKIVETFVPEGARDWGVTRISIRSSRWDELFQRAQTVPMLSPHQVVIASDVDSIEKLGDDARDEIVEALTAYLASPAPFTVLVLEADALDGRQKFTKLLHDKAVVVELKIGAESAATLAAQMAKDLDAAIDRNAADLLADILNGEPARMSVELEKLSAYVGSCGRITTRDVEELVLAARKNTVWQFADMIASRKRDVALEFLDNLLREGEQPAAIIGALAWMYRKLIEARDLPGTTRGFQASHHLGMRAEAAETALRQAHRLTRKELLGGLEALAEADSRLKSANPNPRAVMEFLIARLTSPAASSASSGG
jgi:DNA polymerase III subunit delta